MRRAFAAARDGRDAAIALVRVGRQRRPRAARVRSGSRLPRRCVERAGFGAAVHPSHRPQPGREVHGNGVHMDDYETHDDRRLIPGTGFTIEPGVYTEPFGVRTEINMFVGEREAQVTGPAPARDRATCLTLRRVHSLSSSTGRRDVRGSNENVHSQDHAVLRRSHRGRVGGRRHGDRVAVGPAAGVLGPDDQRAAANTAPLNGPIDAPTFRNIAKAQSPTVVNIQTKARVRGRELTEFFGRTGRSAAALLRWPGAAARAAASSGRADASRARTTRRSRKAPAPASSSTSPASSSPTTTWSTGPTTSGSACSAAAAPRATRPRSSAATR